MLNPEFERELESAETDHEAMVFAFDQFRAALVQLPALPGAKNRVCREVTQSIVSAIAELADASNHSRRTATASR